MEISDTVSVGESVGVNESEKLGVSENVSVREGVGGRVSDADRSFENEELLDCIWDTVEVRLSSFEEDLDDESASVSDMVGEDERDLSGVRDSLPDNVREGVCESLTSSLAESVTVGDKVGDSESESESEGVSDLLNDRMSVGDLLALGSDVNVEEILGDDDIVCSKVADDETTDVGLSKELDKLSESETDRVALSSSDSVALIETVSEGDTDKLSVIDAVRVAELSSVSVIVGDRVNEMSFETLLDSLTVRSSVVEGVTGGENVGEPRDSDTDSVGERDMVTSGDTVLVCVSVESNVVETVFVISVVTVGVTERSTVVENDEEPLNVVVNDSDRLRVIISVSDTEANCEGVSERDPVWIRVCVFVGGRVGVRLAENVTIFDNDSL